MKNTLILGKSDSGKTTGYMFSKVKEMITKKDNLVIVDSKKEYYQTFGQELKNQGYKTLVINLDKPEKSHGFNILWLPYKLYQNNEKDLCLRMLNSIYKEILITKDYQDDNFWINSSANYLMGLTLLLFASGKEEEINLGSLYVLMMEYERHSFDKLKNYLESLSVTNSIYAYLSGTVLAPVDTRGGIMATIKERLCLYVGSEGILNLLCTNDIKLDKLDEPFALFIIDNEDYRGITNAIIDEIGLYLENYQLIIDNADTLNPIIRLSSILENSKINKTATYYLSRNIDNLKRTYKDNIIDKFNEKIDMSKEKYDLMEIGNYTIYPELCNHKNTYIEPSKIELN